MAAFQQLPSMEEMAELTLKTDAAAAASDSSAGGQNKRRQLEDGDDDDRRDDAKKVGSKTVLSIDSTI